MRAAQTHGAGVGRTCSLVHSSTMTTAAPRLMATCTSAAPTSSTRPTARCCGLTISALLHGSCHAYMNYRMLRWAVNWTLSTICGTACLITRQTGSTAGSASNLTAAPTSNSKISRALHSGLIVGARQLGLLTALLSCLPCTHQCSGRSACSGAPVDCASTHQLTNGMYILIWQQQQNSGRNAGAMHSHPMLTTRGWCWRASASCSGGHSCVALSARQPGACAVPPRSCHGTKCCYMGSPAMHTLILSTVKKTTHIALRQRTDQHAISCVMQAVQAVLAEMGHALDFESACVLDASSADKFSCHLILPLAHGCVFVNVQRGPKLLAQRVVELLREHDACWVQHDSFEEKQCIIDLVPYQRNQQLRMIFCTKFGQNRPFMPRHVQLRCGKTCGQWMAQLSRSAVSATTLGKTLVGAWGASVGCTLVDASTVCARQAERLHGFVAQSVTEQCFVQTPLPNLDKWVSTTFSRIRAVRLDKHYSFDAPLLFYYPAYRYCRHVQRAHTRNHVIIEVNVQTRTWRQRCFSVCCRDYVSVAEQVPDDCFSEVNTAVFGGNVDEWQGWVAKWRLGM